MRYSKPSLRERGKGRWQVRIRFKDGDEWRTYACSVEATSRRAAEREADDIRQRLEIEAELGPANPMDPGDDAALVKNYLAHYIDGLEGSGQIEATTAAGYRSSAKHIVGTAGKRVTFHDLRHTYATYLIARRVDVKTVASLMGHADATVTLNVYASADPEARRQAADVVARAMSERDSVEGS